jgi:hypothetical protein
VHGLYLLLKLLQQHNKAEGRKWGGGTGGVRDVNFKREGCMRSEEGAEHCVCMMLVPRGLEGAARPPRCSNDAAAASARQEIQTMGCGRVTQGK